MCIANYVKPIMVIFNTLFVLIGMCVVIVASYIYMRYTDWTAGPFLYAYIAVLVIACITVLIAFCGCYGAAMNSPCLLFSYSALMFLLTILKGSIAAYLLTDIENLTKIGMEQIKQFSHLLSMATERYNVIHYAVKTTGYLFIASASLTLVPVAIGLYMAFHVRNKQR